MKSLTHMFVCIALLTLSACTGLSNWSAGQQSHLKQQQLQDLEHLNSHLSLMREITSGPYQQRLNLFTRVQEELQAQSSSRAAFRHALALTTRGHPNADIGKGYTELSRLIDAPGDLTTAELNLARVVAHSAAQLMILETRNAELDDIVSDTRSRISKSGRSSRIDLQQARERLAQAELEIETLQAELAEAEAKLDAIKNIEVSSE
ncbi:MAG: hypothetical protein HKN70_09410 [Gammaproteobacteria bacterium]|nr:hypothetical protein [Gammaproteobacteria bacterium]